MTVNCVAPHVPICIHAYQNRSVQDVHSEESTCLPQLGSCCYVMCANWNNNNNNNPALLKAAHFLQCSMIGDGASMRGLWDQLGALWPSLPLVAAAVAAADWWFSRPAPAEQWHPRSAVWLWPAPAWPGSSPLPPELESLVPLDVNKRGGWGQRKVKREGGQWAKLEDKLREWLFYGMLWQ